jgi:hypothetical protein
MIDRSVGDRNPVSAIIPDIVQLTVPQTLLVTADEVIE